MEKWCDNEYGKRHTEHRARCPLGWNPTVNSQTAMPTGTMRMATCIEEHCSWWAGDSKGCVVTVIAQVLSDLAVRR